MCDLGAVLGACRGQWPSPQCEAAVAAGGDTCLRAPAFDVAGAPPVAFYVCPSSRGGRLEVACARLGYTPAGPEPAGPEPARPEPAHSEVPTFTQSLLTLHPAGGQTFQSAGGLAGTAVQAGVLAGAYTAYRRNALGMRKFRYLDTARRIPEALGLVETKAGHSGTPRPLRLGKIEQRSPDELPAQSKVGNSVQRDLGEPLVQDAKQHPVSVGEPRRWSRDRLNAVDRRVYDMALEADQFALSNPPHEAGPKPTGGLLRFFWG
jgi:hypothetical protein